jgi:alpha-beta hydrolase superfamily lysophospholipase
MMPVLPALALSVSLQFGDLWNEMKSWAVQYAASTDWGSRKVASDFLAPKRASDPSEWEDAGLTPRTIQLDLHDGFWTQGLLVPAEGLSKGTVILLHGYANCKDITAGFAKRLHTAGYTTLSFDMRGHGSSSAPYCTFGFREKTDVSSVIDDLLAQGVARPPFMVLGTSMGAAVGIQAMEQDQRICFGVFDSSFDSLNHVAPKWLGDSGIDDPVPVYRAAKTLTGVSLDSVAPVASMRKIDRPIFIIHGTDDCMIPESEAEALYDSSPSPKKRILRIEHGNHGESLAEGHPWSDGAWSAVLEFLDSSQTKPSPPRI